MNIADEGMRYKSQLYELYEMAFPEQEKKPLHVMEQLVEDGKMEMLAIVDGDVFVGLAIKMLSGILSSKWTERNRIVCECV